MLAHQYLRLKLATQYPRLALVLPTTWPARLHVLDIALGGLEKALYEYPQVGACRLVRVPVVSYFYKEARNPSGSGQVHAP